jgi:response regulator of citrate/malate metabolism
MTEARWEVLIAEDDLRLASIYAKAIADLPRLRIAGVVTDGEQALHRVLNAPVDLVILDLQLAGLDGVSVLHGLRKAGSSVEVIVVTGHRDAARVRSVIHHGALDYIVKPFELERLRKSVGLFLSRMATLNAGQLEQDAIDRVSGAFRPPGRWLPKGLTDAVLRQVRSELEALPRPTSSLEVSERTGLARVTVRRYLEYLVATNQASVAAEPNGTGRPRKLYKLKVFA